MTESESATATVGAQLRRAREAKGMATAQIAAELKVQERFLAALEADDFASLPQGSYPAIYVKTYARYLGLDPQQALKDFHLQRNPPPPPAATPAPGRVRQLLRDRALLATLAALGLVVLLILLNRRGDRVPTPPPAPAGAGDTAAAAPAPVVSELVTGDDYPARVAAALAAGDAAAKARLARETLAKARAAAGREPLVAAAYYRLHAQLEPAFPLDATLDRLAAQSYDAGAKAYMRGERAQALPLLALAVKLSGRDAYHHFLYGRALDLNGQAAEAEAEYRAAIAINRPAHPRYRYYLAALLAKTGRADEARTELAAYTAAGGEAALAADAAALAARLGG